MTLSVRQAPVRVILIAALLLVLAPAAQGAGQQRAAQARDAEKKKKAREKGFLMRAVEDSDRSQGFAKEIVALLEKQYDAAADTSDSEQRGKDLRDLLDWYQQYRVWLKGMASAVEADVDEHFSRHEAGSAWISRYDKLAKGYHRLSRELSGNVQRLEKEQPFQNPAKNQPGLVPPLNVSDLVGQNARLVPARHAVKCARRQADLGADHTHRDGDGNPR